MCLASFSVPNVMAIFRRRSLMGRQRQVGRRKSRFSTNIWLSDRWLLQCNQQLTVIRAVVYNSCTSVYGTDRHASVSLAYHMDHYTPNRRKQNLIVRSGKPEAEATNNARLRSTYCTIEANYWQTRSIARPLCDNRTCCQTKVEACTAKPLTCRMYWTVARCGHYPRPTSTSRRHFRQARSHPRPTGSCPTPTTTGSDDTRPSVVGRSTWPSLRVVDNLLHHNHHCSAATTKYIYLQAAARQRLYALVLSICLSVRSFVSLSPKSVHKTRFSQKLSNLELWSLSYMGF